MSTGEIRKSPIYCNAPALSGSPRSALGGDNSTIKACLEGFDGLNSLYVANGSSVSNNIGIECE